MMVCRFAVNGQGLELSITAVFVRMIHYSPTVAC